MNRWDEAVDTEGRHPSEELRDEIAALSLGALGDDEAAGLREHLERCEHCRGEFEWLEPAVDLLPATVAQLSPPVQLKARIMAEVEREAALERAAATERTPSPAPRRRFAINLWRPAVGAAAAGVLALGVGVGLVVSGDGGPVTVPVEPSAAVSPAAAELVRDGDALTLDVHRLPSLDQGTVYQVWLMPEGSDRPTPSKTFELDADRTALVEIGAVPDDTAALLVTAEPAGGSESPTSEPILTATL
jgi:hypothetical protein